MQKDNYNPTNTEKEILDFWEKNNTFITKEKQEKFIMVLPPPNITGKLHIGHALMISIQDCIARYERLKGKQVLFLPGTDHAGIATQTVIEKMIDADQKSLGLENNFTLNEKYLYAEKWKETYQNEIYQQLKRMGASCDFSKAKFTLDKDFSDLVIDTFIRLYNEKMIYRDYRLVNYSPKLKSVISDLEVENKEIKGGSKLEMDGKVYKFGLMYYFKYPVIMRDTLYKLNTRDPIGYLEVCTTRPETIYGDTAVVLHSKEEFYKKMNITEVKNEVDYCCVNPLTNIVIPIIFDKSIDNEFGTGVMKVTPGHDFNDYELAKNHNLKIINILQENKIINTNNLRFEERINVIKILKEKELLTRIENYDMTLPLCSRTGDIIEPILTYQWFCDMNKAKELSLKLIDNITFTPPESKKVIIRWIENVKEWCLSRQLWWGHSIPAYKVIINNEFITWIVKKDVPNKEEVIESLKSSKAMSKLKSILKVNELTNNLTNININDSTNDINNRINDLNNNFNYEKIKLPNDINNEVTNDINDLVNEVIKENVSSEYDYTFNINLNELNVNELSLNTLNTEIMIGLIKDKDVLDTWFSSALCPLVHMNYPNEEFTPTSLLETGSDILFFWVARMIFMNVLLTNTIPFTSVLLHGIIRDSMGRKMSKSLGNVIDPLFIINGCELKELNDSISSTLSKKERDISLTYQKKTFPNGIKKCGADALRFCLLNYINDSKDISLDIKRVEGYSRFSNKLYHMVKYFSSYLENKRTNNNIKINQPMNDNIINDSVTNECINWIYIKLNQCIKNVTFNLEKYNFMDACISLHSFILYDLCDIALEISKEMDILNSDILKTTLILLHPFMPFISESFYQRTKKYFTKSCLSILDEEWPKEFIIKDNSFEDVIKEIKSLRLLNVKSVEVKYLSLVKSLTKKNLNILNELDMSEGKYVKYQLND
ncbi:hypothetical protein H312_02900 [Anncaliia algerae PRA339]|uniref:valine--tRNA ligase n=1 Tax=Anncaliia algerae PRA339 TaxID=1288291 RepID=A0A059EXR6_9MICR|nr:hypothetical protein H312_02900 [Anncaliia algerae PRA339]